MLFQEAERFAVALDSIGEAVAFLDVEAGIRHVNRAFEETFGYAIDELRGRSIAIISAGLDGELDQEIFKLGVLGGWTGEVLRKTKSGEILNILLTVTPVKDQSGRVIGRISVSRDVTERKKVSERLNEQTRLASVGELAAGVAHEINNPLTTILLGSELMSDADLPSESLKDLATISNAAHRAAKVVQSLLLFARREDPQPEPMRIDSVIEQTLELKQHDFELSNIETVKNFQSDLPNCLIDRHQMSQVVLNILNNSEDALIAQQGRGKISINVESSTDHVTVEFRDNGPGIAPDVLNRIFEPFYTTKNPGEGTGMGLSICHGIVKQHGGEMWATSSKSAGISFFVRLPITDVVAFSQSPDIQRYESKFASTGRLLVVDDEADIRQIVAKGLLKDFKLVDQAPNGEVALDMIRSNYYDCILLDLKMPGISGVEVFERVARYGCW